MLGRVLACSEEERLAGSIGFVAQAADGTFLIIDWKRSKNLQSKFSNDFQRMKSPLSHLDDCAGNHYSLQLNVYKYLLEKYYSVSVSRMLIVCAHPDSGLSPFAHAVRTMGEELQELIVAVRPRRRRTMMPDGSGLIAARAPFFRMPPQAFASPQTLRFCT